MPYYWSNGGASALATNLAQSATIATMVDAEVYPEAFPYLLQIWDSGTYADPNDDSGMEIVEVIAADGNTLTIERGKDGTADQAHSSGEVAVNNLVAEGLNFLARHYGTNLTDLTDNYGADDLDTSSEVAAALNATNALCNQLIAIMRNTLLGND